MSRSPLTRAVAALLIALGALAPSAALGGRGAARAQGGTAELAAAAARMTCLAVPSQGAPAVGTECRVRVPFATQRRARVASLESRAPAPTRAGTPPRARSHPVRHHAARADDPPH